MNDLNLNHPALDAGVSRRGVLGGALGLGLAGALGGGIVGLAADADASARGNVVLRIARSKMNCRYVLGKSGPSQFDCAGLVRFSANHAFNANLPAGTGAQFNRIHHNGGARSLGQVGHAGYGDPVFFYSSHTGWYDHVGVYAGGGQVLSACQSQGKVCIRPMSFFAGKGYTHIVLGTW